MKIQQKLFMDGGPFVDLSNKMLAGYAIFVNKASAAGKVIKSKVAVQPAAVKTCRNMPGTFCVLKIIQNCEEGVDPTTLKMMTGFDNHKVDKILYKLFKHGKIRIESGGLYTGVNKRER
jgi:hypothetical protein